MLKTLRRLKTEATCSGYNILCDTATRDASWDQFRGKIFVIALPQHDDATVIREDLRFTLCTCSSWEFTYLTVACGVRLPEHGTW